MQSLETRAFAGLFLLGSCVRAQPLACPLPDDSASGPARTQYCLTLKIIAGKLAVD